jgi:hypothetical protein
MATTKAQRHPAGVALLALLAMMIAASCSAISVLPLRVDNPSPDGDGVVFIRLQSDPTDVAPTNFKIMNIDFIAGQALKLWNDANNDCTGTTLAVNDLVPANGKVCFWADTSSPAEFENSFTYAAVDASTAVGTPQTVTVVNYNVQLCPAIPDLGSSGFASVPPSPIVSITLSGLEIKFEVTAAYVRNQTAWFIDFFDFDSSAGADSADGTGRTCSNHDASTFAGIDFSQWWNSQPRATFDSSVDATVENALSNPAFPMYDPASTKWAITQVGCDTVKYTATIPTVHLISNAASDCQKSGSLLTAATATGLNYTANLYTVALRPKDMTNPAAGYYKATFVHPFSFRLQQTVTDIQTTDSAFNFQVAVDDLLITQGTNLTLLLETIISKPGVNSPDLPLANFALASYPNQAAHTTASKLPAITRLSDNGHCGASSPLPCAISWSIVLPELSQAEAGGSMSAYNQQYIGSYSFTWQTSTLDALAANLIINAMAANGSDLGQLAVSSAIHFFQSSTNMYDTSSTGLLIPTFSSGEQIWVRHSFLVDTADIAAYLFTLQRAWVCWSPVSDFTPTVNPGTGCSQDISGVMEASLGHRFLLYNITVGGIVDTTVPAGSTQKSRVWGWTQVGPTSANWAGGATVHNGFAINALPLVFDAAIHSYFFHLVSEVSQAPLPNTRKRQSLQEQETIIAKRATGSGAAVSGITVVAASDNSAASAMRANWLDLFQ